MARPKKQIDQEQVKRLASIHCTMQEIASIVECSVDTLERRFAEVIKDARNTGKMSLRRKQFEVAMSGNPQMLVWLGKQHLGQSDKTEEIGVPPIRSILVNQYRNLPPSELTAKIQSMKEHEDGDDLD